MFWFTKKYICESINYLSAIDPSGINRDQAKENYFEILKKGQKLYTKNDIQKISKQIGYDVWKSFVWIDISLYKKCFFPKIKEERVERWVGVKSEIIDKQNVYSILSMYLNDKEFYNKEFIQKISSEVGFDIYDVSDWTLFYHTIIEFPKKKVKYEFFQKPQTQYMTPLNSN